MGRTREGTVTRLLARMCAGNLAARDRLAATVYADLRAVAERLLLREFSAPGDLTLQPSVLVNEAWLRLIKQRQKYDNRGQFFAIATRIMMRVLMDYARERKAAKRSAGGGCACRWTS